jgi:uncharacterized membrane protein YeaQ/YmgE (transglycosylase-associated protein family)
MFNVIGLVVIGFVVGVLARLIKPGRQNISLLWTFLLGLAGAIIGGLVASAIGHGDIWELNFPGTVVAVIAAIVLIGAAEGFVGSKKND